MQLKAIVTAILVSMISAALVVGCAGQGASKRSDAGASVKKSEPVAHPKRPEPGSRSR